MTVECFECGAAVAAESVDAVADAFIAHGKSAHSWEYPEKALRTYVRNYTDATERLTGSTERLAAIGPVVVHRVDEDRIDDWLGFFDHDGFAGNPGWASCYCLEPHAPASVEEAERPWRTTRSMMVDRLRNGSTVGYLAYVDGKVAGWVNASLRAECVWFQGVDPEGPEPRAVIASPCFVIAPPFRRHGIASALLDRVIADAPSRGIAWVEGYPHNDPERSDAGHFRGPRGMYAARGFEVVAVRERDTVMRLRVQG